MYQGRYETHPLGNSLFLVKANCIEGRTYTYIKSQESLDKFSQSDSFGLLNSFG